MAADIADGSFTNIIIFKKIKDPVDYLAEFLFKHNASNLTDDI